MAARTLIVMDVRALLAEDRIDPRVERTLARSAQEGDAAARAALIRSSLVLVAMRVMALRVPPARVDDAFQDGVIGLIAAIDRFDPERGTRLSTWAWPWITREIRRSLHVREAPGLDDIEAAEAVDHVTDALDAALDALPALERQVLCRRFGIGASDHEPQTRAQVAAALDLGLARTRSCEARALARVRVHLARVGDRAPRAGADPP